MIGFGVVCILIVFLVASFLLYGIPAQTFLGFVLTPGSSMYCTNYSHLCFSLGFASRVT